MNTDTRNDRHKSYGEDYEFDEHYRIRVSHAGKRIDSTLTKEVRATSAKTLRHCSLYNASF